MRLRIVLAAAALVFYIGCGDKPADVDSNNAVFRGNSVVAFSPDGKTLAVAGQNYYGDAVLLFDAETGEVKKALEGHKKTIRSVMFSPDGKTLVSGSGWMDDTIRVWDVEAGALLNTLNTSGSNHVVTFSPDGKTLVSGDHWGNILFWDVSAWTHTQTKLDWQHTNSLAFSPDGQRLAVGATAIIREVSVFDGKTAEPAPSRRGHTGAEAALSRKVRVFDGKTAKLVQSLRGHRDMIASVAYSPDGNILAIGGSEGQITLWNAYTGKRLQKLKGHESGVSSLSFSPDSKTLVSGSPDKTIQLWDVQTRKLIKTIQDADGSISVAYSPDGTTIASGSLDAGVRLWNAETGELMKTLEDYRHAVRFLAFSQDGESVAVDGSGTDPQLANMKTFIRFLDPKTLKEKSRMTDHIKVVGFRVKALSAAYSPDGRTLAVGNLNSFDLWRTDAYHWDAEKRAAVKKEYMDRIKLTKTDPQIDDEARDRIVSELSYAIKRNQYSQSLRPVFGDVLCAAFSTDGKRIVSGLSSGMVILYDVRTGKSTKAPTNHKSPVRFVEFTPDGKAFVSGGLDGTVRFWDAETGAPIRDLKGHKGMAYAGGYSPDGKTLAVASSKTVAVWDAKTDALLHTLEGHDGAAFCLAFSPDGSEIATGGRDKTVRRWNAQTGELIKTLKKHAAPVTAVAYSPDGSDLLSGDANGKILRWNLND